MDLSIFLGGIDKRIEAIENRLEGFDQRQSGMESRLGEIDIGVQLRLSRIETVMTAGLWLLRVIAGSVVTATVGIIAHDVLHLL